MCGLLARFWKISSPKSLISLGLSSEEFSLVPGRSEKRQILFYYEGDRKSRFYLRRCAKVAFLSAKGSPIPICVKVSLIGYQKVYGIKNSTRF